MELGLGG